MIAIKGLREATQQLARLDRAVASDDLMAPAAQLLAESVRQALAARSTDDRAKAPASPVTHSVAAGRATIACTERAAVAAELGTQDAAPRPFLASTVDGVCDRVARTVADRLVESSSHD